MKKRIICMILSLVAIFSFLGFKATQAWFSAGENKIQSLEAGDLVFTIGDFPTMEKVLPGDTVDMSSVTVTNESNIDTKVRVKFSVTDANGQELENAVIVESEGWTLNGGYYEYNDIISAGESMPFITSMQLNGEAFDISFNNKATTVKVIFEARQAYYVEWEKLGTIEA